MQEVTGKSQSHPWRLLSPVGFWLLAAVAVGLFVLPVLAGPLAQRRAVLERQAIEEAKTRQIEQLAADLAVVRDALADDPQYIARRAREDLGYRKPGEQAMPFDVETVGTHLEPLDTELPPMTRLERICGLFNAPLTRTASLVASIMALAVAIVCFDIPTRPRQRG
ncbi:MAG: hypothetical protein GWP05_00010 [Anaerolineaceae bacterium]|nr:hypothetical protein [Anaerolineaceae bacterium]